MFDNKSSLMGFQTFYASKENSLCPQIPELVKIGKTFVTKNLLDNISETVISLRYGRRVLINSDNSNIGELQQEDFLEIVDYDPLRNVLLVMGTKEPRIESPSHWLIHHARDEVKAIIQINSKRLIEKFEKKFPITEKEYPNGTLDQVKEILLKLRNSKIVVIKNQGLLFVGNNMKEVEDLVIKTFEE